VLPLRTSEGRSATPGGRFWGGHPPMNFPCLSSLHPDRRETSHGFTGVVLSLM
jgi:hypothetical protein